MFDSEYREVDFATYCPKCVHEKKTESDRPCCWCLSMPTNLYTDKPTGFEEKKKKQKKDTIMLYLLISNFMVFCTILFCVIGAIGIVAIVVWLISIFKEEKKNGNREEV